MKKQFLFVCVCLIVCSGLAFADWSAEIQAVGQNLGGQYKSSVTIGVGSNADSVIAPPKAPSYSCYMSVHSSDWKSTLAKDIREDGFYNNSWVIGVNPAGNMTNGNGKVSLTWDSSKLKDGSFEIRKGWDGNGDIVVSDMKSVSSFEIQGDNEELYFTIINNR
jgi:hypothetical protein